MGVRFTETELPHVRNAAVIAPSRWRQSLAPFYAPTPTPCPSPQGGGERRSSVRVDAGVVPCRHVNHGEKERATTIKRRAGQRDAALLFQGCAFLTSRHKEEVIRLGDGCQFAAEFPDKSTLIEIAGYWFCRYHLPFNEADFAEMTKADCDALRR